MNKKIILASIALAVTFTACSEKPIKKKQEIKSIEYYKKHIEEAKKDFASKKCKDIIASFNKAKSSKDQESISSQDTYKECQNAYLAIPKKMSSPNSKW